VSEFLKGRLAELFDIRPERVAVVGNGVEEAYYKIGAGPPPPPGPPYVLVVGGLTQRKGGTATLRLARALRDQGRGVEVRVAGQSEPDLAAAARDHPNVKQLGYRGVDTGLPELMRGAAALVFLSRYETFGIPAAEAMAAGTPAVVSGYAGLPEVVGAGGLVVDSDQPTDVADLVLRLIEDGPFRAAVIDRGRRRSLDHTWANCAARVCAALTRAGG
jgi:glycosyltransferase involved in cell wall biosynthesis